MAIEEGSRGQGSYAHASVNADVLEVYTFFDEVMISQCVNNQLIRRLIDYNFMNVREYPVFSFKRDWFGEIVKIAQGLEALTRIGVGIPVDWIYARTGIPKPKAFPLLLGSGRRYSGPESAPVLPECCRVRHDSAGGVRSCQYHQLPDAQFIWRP